MVLGIEHFLYVFYTFQIIRLIVSDDMTLLAKKIFEFMSVKFILGTAIKIIDFAHGGCKETIDSRLFMDKNREARIFIIKQIL